MHDSLPRGPAYPLSPLPSLYNELCTESLAGNFDDRGR